jgi:hypothetical protein
MVTSKQAGSRKEMNGPVNDYSVRLEPMQASWTLSMFLSSNKVNFIIPLSLLFLLIGQSHAHDHHSAVDPSGPLDALIILHICVQFLVWCILFPIGLIYGFTRYCSLNQCAVILLTLHRHRARWHVPLQVRMRPLIS